MAMTPLTPETQSNRVSVVVAAYNMGRFLPEAIRSIQAQTLPVQEIHVVDDGSTDDTPQAIRAFLSDARVRYHRQSNMGQAVAKNNGIRACSGDLVAFLDADDLWTPERLEVMLPHFDGVPRVGVVYSNYVFVDEQARYIRSPDRPYHSGRITGRLLIDNFVTGMASIVRRECFDAVGLFDESLPMGIDYDLWLRISTKYEFLFVDKVTYLYRTWPGQMSRNFESRFECAIQIMNRFLAQHGELVTADEVREAWAHTYVERGKCYSRLAGRPVKALRDHIRALGYDWTYVPAWKELVKLAIRR